MHTLLYGMLFAASFGPMGPDAPAHTPQLATNGTSVGLTFGAGNTIYFAASQDGGKTFHQPVKVAQSDIVPLTRHRGPRIVFIGSTILISAVTGKTPSHEQHAHGLPSDGDLTVWRSTDLGKNWSQGTIINDAPGAPTEGLHTLATDGKATVFAAWLDKRTGNGTQLYGSVSRDAGATWSKNTRIYQSPDGTICECCHPSATIDANGQIVVMWRNWLGGARDMYLARSGDGKTFGQAEKLGTGTWQLNACPMDGGGIALAQGQLQTAWRRENTIYTARPGARETALGQGKDIAVTVSTKGLYIAWVSAAGIVLHEPNSLQPTSIATGGAYPTIVALNNGTVLVAWENNGTIQQKTITTK